jgi:hypothetical protein
VAIVSDLRSKILSSDDLPEVAMYVKLWDVNIIVRGMSAGGRGALMDKAMDKMTKELDFGKLYPLLLVATVYDPDTDQKIFTLSDVGPLLEKSGAAMEEIAQVAMKLSGFDTEETEELGKDS